MNAPDATRWPAVLALVGCGVVSAFQVGKVPPALPALRADFALSLPAAGWVLSMLSVAAALLGMFAGLAIDRGGPRRLILLGLAGTACGSLLGAVAPGAGLLLGSRALEGLGYLVLIAGLPTLLVRFTAAPDRGLVMGLWGAFMPTGIMLSLLFAPALIELLDWRGLWAAVAGSFAVAGLALARTVPPDPPPVQASRAADLLQVLRRPGPVLIGLCFGCFAAQHVSVLSFLPLWLVEERGYALFGAAAAAALVTGVNIPGNLLGGWLLRRGAAGWQLISCGALVMGSASLVVYDDAFDDLTRGTALLLFSGVGGLIPVSLFHAVAVHAPAARLIGTGNGVLVQLNNTGQLVGPPALAALVAAGGWGAAPAMLVGLALAVLACALLLRHLEPAGA